MTDLLRLLPQTDLNPSLPIRLEPSRHWEWRPGGRARRVGARHAVWVYERAAVQARTFTRWINLVLQRNDPPAAVRDLFKDIRDGRILMALLERLSGSQLVRGNLPLSSLWGSNGPH
uniref:Calponin-homology (CH) domain-containing protein n=1 Tax=Takifugu rubripes TaxID=31033 RepID=A0A674N6M8_TAKRU